MVTRNMEGMRVLHLRGTDDEKNYPASGGTDNKKNKG
jgi:hypothetical protein